MRATWIALLIPVAVLPAAAPAEELAAALEKDVVLRALVDELERNSARLELADLDRPYFIELGIQDAGGAYVSAALGAVTGRNEGRNRSLSSDVRVGSYTLDNGNFSGGGYGGMFGLSMGEMGGAEVPLEDDYNAIRQAIWWIADRDYKNVAETFVQKKAFMESKLIEDKPDDFSRETPAVHLEERLDTRLELAALEGLAVALSAVFREYPDIQASGVSVSGSATNRYLVNSEGTRLRTGMRRYSLGVRATVQAEDGMRLGDTLTLYAGRLEDLPPQEELVARCRELAKQLLALRAAPVLESYTGPVLFEPEAAASLFARNFGGAFGGGQRPVGSRSNPDDFANKLNKRILPRFLDVVDDPTQAAIGGVAVMGHYRYDDQAVAAQKVSLVEDGRLKALLMSRNPSKEFKQSNGHGRGGLGSARGAVGCLMVSADNGLDAAGLRQELLDACADEGLEFGIRIASLGSTGDGGGRFGRGGEFAAGISPLVMYKVYPDGREELVRGAEIARVDLKAFKRMLAAGDKPYVLNTGGRGQGTTVAVPALLFEELDLAKIDRDFDKPPILPSPLARTE